MADQLPLSQGTLQAMARQAAVGQGLDPRLFMSLIQHESGWNPDIVSPAGAIGLGQLMPATAQSLGVQDPRNPVQNLRGAAHYLKQQLTAFNNDPHLALAAYNAGPAAVKKYGGIPPYQETQDYVKNVMGGMNAYGQAPAQGPVTGPPTAAGPPLPQPMAGQPQQPAQQALPPITLGNPFQGMQQLSMMPMKGLMKLPGLNLNQMFAPTTIPGIPGTPATPTQPQTPQAPSQVRFTVDHPSSLVSPHAQAAVNLAKEYLGTPYAWGGDRPGGFDCSGLLQYVWAKQGVSIPRTTYDQWDKGIRVPTPALQPGDAVFFKGSDSRTVGGRVLPGHVGMYIGGGQYIQAPHTGDHVRISKLADAEGYMGARRYGAKQ